jgi:hemolysin III
MSNPHDVMEQPSAGAIETTLQRGRDKLYSWSEELSHALTHGLGIVLGIVGLVVLVAQATLYGDVWHIVSCAIFGGSLVLMYTASTLYHSIRSDSARPVLHAIDHAMIYVLIAGTYTPFTLVTLRGPWGWSLFGTTWAMALVGAAFKTFHTGRFEKLSLAIYLIMGWCIVIAIKPLIHAMPSGGIILLILGGLAYTVGVIFYVWERLPYHHMIWHLFVLAGSVLHYFAVLLYVVPDPV